MLFYKILTIILSLIIYFVIKKLYLWYKERKRIVYYLNKIPGDDGLPIIGNLLEFQCSTAGLLDKTYEFIQWMNKNNTSILKKWIANHAIVYVSSPNAQKIILENPKETTKASTYNLLKEWLSEGLVTGSGDKWRHRRRLINPTFNFKMLLEYHVIFNEESKILVNVLDKFKDTGKEIEVLEFMKRCLFDTILRTAFGHKLGSQENPDDTYLHAIENFAEMAYVAAVNYFYRNKYIFYLSGNGFKKDGYLKILRKFANDLIQISYKKYLKDKENGKIEHKTFISMLLEEYENNEITMDGIREEVDNIIFGGFDTSSSTMSWILWALATNPEIQEKVYEEIYDIFGEEEKIVTFEDINKMTYFDMILKEVLRRFSIVSVSTRKLQNDVKIDGYTIPKGVDVILGPFLINMNEKVFPDPYKFDPDRFLPEISATRSAFDFIPFSAGPRNCVGQKYANHVIKIISVWVLRRYKVRANYPMDYLKMLPQVITNSDKGFPIIFESRIK